MKKLLFVLIILSVFLISSCNSGSSSSPPQQTCTNVYKSAPEKECIQVQSGGAMSGSCVNTESCAGFCTNICNKELQMVYASYTSRIEDKLIGHKTFCVCRCADTVCN